MIEMNMKYVIDKRDEYAVIELLVEKLMSSNAPKLKTEITMLSSEGYKSLALDLGHVDFVDSSGLSSILLAKRVCEESGGQLALSGLNPAVKTLIDISQLNEVLNIFPSQEEAIEFISK